jgi:hypothetical protein
MFAGLDVHKDSIDICVAEEGRHRAVRHIGVIRGDLEAIDKLLRAAEPLRAHIERTGPSGTDTAASSGLDREQNEARLLDDLRVLADRPTTVDDRTRT